jgi:SAM-dependent methyltransferase
MNECAAGHKEHDRLIVPTILGGVVVYDWQTYMGFKGYCTGQDAVSQTLKDSRGWDMRVFDCLKPLLKRDTLFVDVGCHLGWFSRLAYFQGCEVLAFDADAENIELFTENVPGKSATLTWFGEDTVPTEVMDIEVAKLDIEGNEQHAIRYFEKSFEQGRVKHLIMEVSPVFNSSYEDLLEKLKSWGYIAYELDGTPFSYDYNFQQKDLWLHQ